MKKNVNKVSNWGITLFGLFFFCGGILFLFHYLDFNYNGTKVDATITNIQEIYDSENNRTEYELTYRYKSVSGHTYINTEIVTKDTYKLKQKIRVHYLEANPGYSMIYMPYRFVITIVPIVFGGLILYLGLFAGRKSIIKFEKGNN